MKPTGMYLRRLEQGYMEEQKEKGEMNQAQQHPWLVNNILFCYEGEIHTKNDSESKKHFLKNKGNHINNKEAYTDRSKRTGRKEV